MSPRSRYSVEIFDFSIPLKKSRSFKSAMRVRRLQHFVGFFYVHALASESFRIKTGAALKCFFAAFHNRRDSFNAIFGIQRRVMPDESPLTVGGHDDYFVSLAKYGNIRVMGREY